MTTRRKRRLFTFVIKKDLKLGFFDRIYSGSQVAGMIVEEYGMDGVKACRIYQQITEGSDVWTERHVLTKESELQDIVGEEEYFEKKVDGSIAW